MNNWRDQAEAILNRECFQCLSPLRGSMGAGERAEFYRDKWDIEHSDVILVNLSDSDRVSIGTVMEMMHAHDKGKYVVAVLDKRHDHLFTRECASYLAPTLEVAVAHIIESFGGK